MIESFSIFKKGIRPEWEDKANASGCEWSVKVNMNCALVQAHFSFF